MQMKMRPRYYCDHCKKVSGSKSAMATHEAHCTANPNRWCRMCGSGIAPHHFTGILLRPGNTMEDWKAKMDSLRSAAEGCPCCILAAIRQSGVQKDRCQPDEEGYPDNSAMIWREQGAATGDVWLGFDFKSEKAAYLAQRAESMHSERYY